MILCRIKKGGMKIIKELRNADVLNKYTDTFKDGR